MKPIIFSVLISVALIGGTILLSGGSSSSNYSNPVNANNVSIVDGKQIVEISARGGYNPRFSVATSGIPTILRIKTNGTFDCSSAVYLPSLNYRKNLPQTGNTDIEIPAQAAGTSFQGLCAMGMYNFRVDFK